MKIYYILFVLFMNIFSYVNAIIPSLSVHKIDSKIIEKKRQDTLEICRIFNEQNELLQKASKDDIKSINNRFKRDLVPHDVGNPLLNSEDLRRVENIVDKLYDDNMEQNGQKIIYRQRILNDTQDIKTTIKNNRRYNFAPAKLLGPLEPEDVKEKKPLVEVNTDLDWIKKWHHGIVPYFIDSSSYDVQLMETIVKAFDYFEKATCIRLQRLRERPVDTQSLQSVEWLYIANPSGIKQCVHSNEKKPNNGVQMVVFGYDCMSLGEIVHEVMHILGFSHEHTRPDRDRYLTIKWDNIKPGYKKYFSVREEDPLSSLPYDYASVLHYPPRAFSRNGKVTIMTENGVKIGQREALSETDVEKVSIVYSAECTKRNKEYLLKTCPSVIHRTPDKNTVKSEEIDEYFKERIWPYGIVNYKIRDAMEFTTEEKENIQAVLRHIEKETCIEFRNLNTNKDSPEKDEDPNESDENVTPAGHPLQNKEVTIANNENEHLSDSTLAPLVESDFSNTTLKENTTSVQLDAENEIVNDDRTDEVVVLSKTKFNNRVKRNANVSSPLRRHAANILTLVRSSEPGCDCPPSGRPNGNKVLMINNDCFNSVNDLLHLFVHVLGLDHQHNMHDRDYFLKIVWDKLTPDIRREMAKKLPPAASAGFAYDYQSVMHYPWLQIKDGVTNIMYPIWNDGWAMGHWQGLSFTDVQKLNLIYKSQCAERSKSVSAKKFKRQ
ncbi:uncharacterized protein LOC123700231 [Colias croceus]|uniref:uncharacterized protein LOC123700231 n=1 Tax=Colias crocea TaxID=72248 RepID=UPI001E27F079|nr:uncharacterized protein LOC123700231 [Colias croceus]